MIQRSWKRQGVARPCGWTQAIAALGEMAAALRAHRVDQDELQVALLLGLETRHQNARLDADAARRIVGVRDECEGEELSRRHVREDASEVEIEIHPGRRPLGLE